MFGPETLQREEELLEGQGFGALELWLRDRSHDLQILTVTGGCGIMGGEICGYGEWGSGDGQLRGGCGVSRGAGRDETVNTEILAAPE